MWVYKFLCNFFNWFILFVWLLLKDEKKVLLWVCVIRKLFNKLIVGLVIYVKIRKNKNKLIFGINKGK